MTADSPFVGLPTVNMGGCSYSADLDASGCAEPAAVHPIVFSEAWGVVSLASCERHVPIARASGEAFSEHQPRLDCAAEGCVP